MKLIKNINVYAPEHLGSKDVLIIGDKIAKIEEAGCMPEIPYLTAEDIIDGSGKILTPGLLTAMCIFLAVAEREVLPTARRKRRWKGLQSSVSPQWSDVLERTVSEEICARWWQKQKGYVNRECQLTVIPEAIRFRCTH